MIHIAFDIGNVLCEVNFQPLCDAIRKYYRNGYFDINSTYEFCSSFQVLQDIGATTIKSELKKKFRFNDDTIEIIYSHWLECVQPVEETNQILQELDKNGIKIALLSNIGIEHGEFIRDSFPDIYNTSIQHFSYEIGARKPSKLFFQSFLLENPHFERCVFIDDRKENLRSAKRMGFQTIEFLLDNYENKQQAATDLRQKLIDRGIPLSQS